MKQLFSIESSERIEAHEINAFVATIVANKSNGKPCSFMVKEITVSDDVRSPGKAMTFEQWWKKQDVIGAKSNLEANAKIAYEAGQQSLTEPDWDGLAYALRNKWGSDSIEIVKDIKSAITNSK